MSHAKRTSSGFQCTLDAHCDLVSRPDYIVGYGSLVNGPMHLSDGQRMITCSFDGSLQVWNLRSMKQIGEDWRDGDSEVRTLALSPNGKKVAGGSEVVGH